MTVDKKIVPVENVQAGEIVFKHGYAWQVVKSVFDPIGNGSEQNPAPRYVLYVTAADNEAPPGYAENTSLGYLPGSFVTAKN